MSNVTPLPTPEKAVADKIRNDWVEIAPAPPPLDKRSPFRGWERGEEIAATYRAHDTRAVVGKAIKGRGGKDVHALILGAIDAGILTPTGAATKRPSLRLLISNGPIKYCNQFDLTNLAHRKRIREVLWPIILANKDEVIANPGKLESIIKAHEHKEQAAMAARRREEEVKRKVVEIRTFGQDQCIMYGVRMWPRIDDRNGTYDYDQIRAAAWTIRDWLRWLDPKMSPRSKAICIKNMVRWFGEYHKRAGYPVDHGHMLKVFSLMRKLSDLYAENPKGECAIPYDPKIEGQW